MDGAGMMQIRELTQKWLQTHLCSCAVILDKRFRVAKLLLVVKTNTIVI